MESRQEAMRNQYLADLRREKPCYKCKYRIEYIGYDDTEKIACQKDYCGFEPEESRT